ncbi:MAG: hypothetical protein WBE46_00445 [Dehalococcoidia bacterium]
MHYSLAKRVIRMGKAANIRFKKDIVFSGGVARNTGMVKATKDLLGEEVTFLDAPNRWLHYEKINLFYG